MIATRTLETSLILSKLAFTRTYIYIYIYVIHMYNSYICYIWYGTLRSLGFNLLFIVL